MKPPDGLKFRITGSDPANNTVTVTVTGQGSEPVDMDELFDCSEPGTETRASGSSPGASS